MLRSIYSHCCKITVVPIITVRLRKGKVMFSQASVILSNGGGACVAGGVMCGGGGEGGVRGRRHGHCSGRYASY